MVGSALHNEQLQVTCTCVARKPLLSFEARCEWNGCSLRAASALRCSASKQALLLWESTWR
eukprot:4961504-Amphidinium_carterae.1